MSCTSGRNGSPSWSKTTGGGPCACAVPTSIAAQASSGTQRSRAHACRASPAPGVARSGAAFPRGRAPAPRTALVRSRSQDGPSEPRRGDPMSPAQTSLVGRSERPPLRARRRVVFALVTPPSVRRRHRARRLELSRARRASVLTREPSGAGEHRSGSPPRCLALRREGRVLGARSPESVPLRGCHFRLLRALREPGSGQPLRADGVRGGRAAAPRG